MRPKLTYEELVDQYKQELLNDEEKMAQIEMRLVSKQINIEADTDKKIIH